MKRHSLVIVLRKHSHVKKALRRKNYACFCTKTRTNIKTKSPTDMPLEFHCMLITRHTSYDCIFRIPGKTTTLFKEVKVLLQKAYIRHFI